MTTLIRLIKSIIIISIILCLTACPSGRIEKVEIEGRITDVIDGNTVELNTGTRIHLEGVDPNNAFTKQYLEKHYIGRPVYVDIGADDYPYIDSYDDDFDGFVITGDENECINRTLITIRHDAFYSGNIGDDDTLEAYRKIVTPHDPLALLNDTQLAGKMKAACLLVYTEIGNDRIGLGTAFLINEQGLALTNWHVLDNAQKTFVYLSDSEGNIYGNKCFEIMPNVVHNSTYDYAIFYVNFDEDTRRNLAPLPLTRLSIAAGDKVAVVGNPAPGSEILPMRFAAGKISSYNEMDRNEGQIGIDVAITNGFSGGPLCNYYGEVVGISRSGFSNNDANLNFAVDIQKVREKLDELNLVYEGK